MDQAGPPALEWKPLLDSLRPARGDRLCQGFSGKTRVGSVCSQGRERPGGSGRPHSSEVASASCSAHAPGLCPLPSPRLAPARGTTTRDPHPAALLPLRADPRQRRDPCLPSAVLSSGPTLHPRGAPQALVTVRGITGQTRLRSPAGISRNPVSSAPLEGRGRPGQGPSLSPSSPLPFSPAFPSVSDHLSLLAPVSRGLSSTPDT